MTGALYKDEFLFHYKNQHNNKSLKMKSHAGRDVNFSCGDEISIELEVENGIIKDVGYSSSGCIISTGAISILSDFIIGKNLDFVNSLSEEEYIKLLGIDLTYARKKCALVGFRALKNSIDNNEKRQNKNNKRI